MRFIPLLVLMTSCSFLSGENFAKLSPGSAYKRGLSAYHKKDFKLALLYFDKAYEGPEFRVNAMELELSCYKEQKDYERFIFEANAYIATDGVFDTDIRMMLVEVYEHVANHDKAYEVNEKILFLQPTHEKAQFKKAALNHAMGKFDLALALSDAILTKFPRNKEAFYLRSKIHQQLGRIDKAVADLKEVLAFEPGCPGTLERLVKLYYVNKDWEQAYEVANELYRAGSDRTEVDLLRSSCLIKMSRAPEAAVLLDEVISRSPGPQITEKVADLFYEANQFDSAKKLYSQLNIADPDNDKVNFQHLRIIIDSNDIASAGKKLQGLYEKNPNKEWIVLSYAKMLDHINASDKACALLEKFTGANESAGASLAMESICKNSSQAQPALERMAVAIPEHKPGPLVREIVEHKPGPVVREIASLTDPIQETTIRAGDSLGAISTKFYGTWTKWKIIYQANRNLISVPTLLKIGTRIKIPKG